MNKFKDYVDIIKGNNIYFLATLLDPWVKTQWIKNNLNNTDIVIARLRQFLKDTYHHEVELPSTDESNLHSSLEYRFLKPYSVDVDTDDEHDVDRYLNTQRVKHKLRANKDQTQ
jgi:hypothetical protein